MHEPQKRLRLIFQSFASFSQLPKRFAPIDLGYPRDLVVIRDEIVTYIFDLHVPGFDRAIDERRVRSLAEGIAVLDRALVNELPLILQALDDRLVRILAKQADIFG